jgi:hypothetical protein
MRYLSILLGSIASHENPVLVLPIIIRLGLFLIAPMVEFAFHKLAHHGIMLSIERLTWLKKFNEQIKHLPDLLMIGSLVLLHMFAN